MSEAAPGQALRCPICDFRQQLPLLRPGTSARCGRCKHLLTTAHHEMLTRAFALDASGLMLLLGAASYPFLGVSTDGQAVQMTLFDSAISLIEYREPVLGLIVFVLIFLMPVLLLCMQLSLVALLLAGRGSWLTSLLARGVLALTAWNMVEVFLVGVLVSVAKLTSIASVQIGVSFWCFVGFTLCTLAAQATLDRYQLWRVIEQRRGLRPDRVQPEPSMGCPECQRLLPAQLEGVRCPVCFTSVRPRFPRSLQKTLALLVTAMVLYLPANLLPLMVTTTFGTTTRSTIAGGILLLWQDGSYPTAIIIFIASLLVPILKILMLLWLCYSVWQVHEHSLRERTLLYQLTEFIGRWSMVDVFVVALLVALFQFGAVLAVEPGAAALAFCGVVVFTMLAAQAFDPRLIWDAELSARSARRRNLVVEGSV